MLYLGTSPKDESVKRLLDTHRIGLMCQPASNRPVPGWVWAADNGCFSEKWDGVKWRKWLASNLPRSGCLFAVVPDVVADHAATLERWGDYRGAVDPFPAAFVAQDGATPEALPWDEIDTLFIGGSTAWKMSDAAFDVAAAARARARWVHVGRVNSLKRYRAWEPFADSCDGTFLAFGPTKNAGRLEGWLDAVDREPSLFSTARVGEQ